MEKTDVGVLKPEAIQSKVFTIRGVQVMIDRDLVNDEKMNWSQYATTPLQI